MNNRSLAFIALTAAVTFVTAVGGSTAAHAAAFTWYNGKPKASTWKNISTGANYSRATITTYPAPQAVAHVNVTGIGTTSGSSQVSVSFSPRRVTAKCQWTWMGNYGTAPLKCVLS